MHASNHYTEQLWPNAGRYSIIFQSKSVRTVYGSISITEDTVQLITAEKTGVRLDSLLNDM